MKDIDKLLNDINKYENLDNEQPLESEEKNRIMEMTMKKINDEFIGLDHKSKFKKRKICAILIGALLAFSTVGVSAGVIFNWNEKLSNYLNINTYQKDELVETGMEINQSATDNGLTVTALQSVGDKYGVYILFDIEAPEGMDLTKNHNFLKMKWKIDGIITSNVEYSIINCNKNKATLILNLEMPENVSGRGINIEFENFGYKEEDDDFDIQLEGKWNFSWTLDYEDVSKNYEVNKDLKIYGGEAVFETLNVSPFSTTVILSEKKPFEIHSKDNIWDDNRGIIVKLKSGDIIDRNNCGNIADNLTVITMSFGKVIDVNEIESISFDGIEVKL